MPEHAIVHFPSLVRRELEAARKCEQPIASPHQAYGLLAETIADFFEGVRKSGLFSHNGETLRELVQIAACAQRAAEDLKLLPWPSASPLTGRRD